MAFDLCLAIGCPHPNRLAYPPWNLTAEEFDDWLIRYQWEPWGDRRADWRAAATVANLADHDGERPSLLFPYWEHDTRDVAAAMDAADAHRRKYFLA